MKDLTKRSEFWNHHNIIYHQGNCQKDPFILTPNWQSLYQGKQVLEIGPGEGRQFKILLPLTSSYDIADISPDVVRNPIYKQTHKQSLLTSWDLSLNTMYDTICLWYVFHHVLKSEAAGLISFLSRHTKHGGFVHFNCPQIVSHSGLSVNQDGNGRETTPWILKEILDLFTKPDWIVSYRTSTNDLSNGFVILAQKSDLA